MATHVATTSSAHAHRITAGVELAIAAAAVYGGVGLMADAIGMSDDWLSGTPFRSWVLPGVLLILVVAVPMTVAAVLELRRSPWAGIASVTAGAAQIGCIAAQLLIMQRYHVLQPVMMTVGLLVVLAALAVHRREQLWPAGR